MVLNELIRKANNDDVGAMEELGREYALKGNFGRSIEWNQKATSNGLGAAMFSLFIKYEKGENGFEKNTTLAFKYVEKMSATKGWETFGKLQLKILLFNRTILDSKFRQS